ncbi:MAG: hypothetical protein NC048_03725 [Bacteroides sp.]|nr:hypothetical protein [Ruminococcus flavefaciens]MCM1554584.1 hypothetical protein [Bacteroides sp.]
MRALKYILLSMALWGGLACRCPLGAQAPLASAGVAELAVAENDSPFRVLTLGQLGMLVVMEQNDLYASKPQRSLYFYDENLHKRWQSELPMESRFRYAGHRVEQDSLRFALFAPAGKKEQPEFLELAVCLADGRYNFHTHKVDAESLGKAEFAEFKLSSGKWHFLVLQKNDYVYCVLDLKADTLYRCTVAAAKDYTCCDWQLDGEGNACFVFRDAKIIETGLYYKKISAFGDILAQEVIASPRSDIRLVDARIAVLGKDDLMLGGSWNMARARQGLSNYDQGSETAGLFAMRYRNGGLRDFWMKAYLEYPDLDTLLGSEERYRYSQAMQKANGRTVLPDYLSLLRLLPDNGKFRLVGEVYERVVSTVTEVSYDFYGRMMPYTRVTFEGYRYKDAFYSEFDSSLTNLRNSVFDLEQQQLYDRLLPLSVAVENPQGDLLYGYNYQSAVHYRQTVGENGIGALKNFGLTPLLPGDRLQRTWGSSLTEWFSGCLLAYGYKQIANSRRKGKNRQSVFYMNKVMAETKP